MTGCSISRRADSRAWRKRQRDDPYVARAQREGYRSRACYKLLELHRRDHLFRPGMTVVDLGAAVGSWSQVARRLVGRHGRVIASDLLPMEPIAGVEFVQGDFTDPDVCERIIESLGATPADLVISDMAPNMSGVRALDQPRSLYLVELALEFAQRVLSPGGEFVAKVFQGEGFEQLLGECRTAFARVQLRKPAASRPDSREQYVVARQRRARPIDRGHGD